VLVPLRVPVASRRQRAAAGLETVGPAAGLETVGPGGRAGDGRPRRPCWRRSAPAAGCGPCLANCPAARS